MSTASPLTQHQQTLIAGEAIVAVNTVRNVYAGRGNSRSYERVRRAAEALKLPAPPVRAATTTEPAASAE